MARWLWVLACIHSSLEHLHLWGETTIEKPQNSLGIKMLLHTHSFMILGQW